MSLDYLLKILGGEKPSHAPIPCLEIEKLRLADSCPVKCDPDRAFPIVTLLSPLYMLGSYPAKWKYSPLPLPTQPFSFWLAALITQEGQGSSTHSPLQLPLHIIES